MSQLIERRLQGGYGRAIVSFSHHFLKIFSGCKRDVPTRLDATNALVVDKTNARREVNKEVFSLALAPSPATQGSHSLKSLFDDAKPVIEHEFTKTP